jgi:ATP adenylyltransferase
MAERIVDTTNARTDEYAKVLHQITADGKCPFCWENFAQYSRSRYQPSKDTDSWYIVRNSWPYPYALCHFLIISKRHILSLQDVTAGDWLEVQKLIAFLVDEYALTGFGLVARSGNPQVTGATILHFHWQFIVPNKEEDPKTYVSFPIG